MKSFRKRIIHELSVEELLKLATSSDEDVVMEKLTDSAKFIYELGIKPGDEKVSAQMIFHHYKQWKRDHLQPRAYFFRDFSKYFERLHNEDGSYYLLDPKPFDLSEEEWWRMRADFRNEKARLQRKRNSGKKSNEEK